MGRGHCRGYNGFEQPRASNACAAVGLAAEGTRSDRRDRAGVLPAVGLALIPTKAGIHTPWPIVLVNAVRRLCAATAPCGYVSVRNCALVLLSQKATGLWRGDSR